KQALEWGLVNRLVPAADLGSATAALAASLAAGPSGAFGLLKRSFNRAVLPNLEEALDYEAHMQEIASKDAEHREGVAAFLEKRSPHYT
ncbi:MAG: enoyl-CoA hydratase-related protein, partial [Anaerolineales bacterium]|nr:enoyl-CoA hydratase-related protein [Anaerolineales bacterium]